MYAYIFDNGNDVYASIGNGTACFNYAAYNNLAVNEAINWVELNGATEITVESNKYVGTYNKHNWFIDHNGVITGTSVNDPKVIYYTYYIERPPVDSDMLNKIIFNNVCEMAADKGFINRNVTYSVK